MLEVFTIRFSWTAMWRTLQDQVLNPPLDYAVLKVFEVVDPSDATRRIVPALWGAACVVVFGRLISRRAGPRVGVAAATFLAFAPYHVHYSQEVRPYSLGMLLTTSTLLFIDRYLDKPGWRRLLLVVCGSIAAAYTMFLAALTLLIAGATLVLEDALLAAEPRRRAARRLLIWSPAFALAVGVAYIPWWPMLWRAIHAPAISAPPALSFRRVGRVFSYFGFGFHDWYPLGAAGAFFIALVLLGSVLAVAKYRLRFLLAWAVIGIAAVEAMEHRHGVYDAIFHLVPAGIALTGLAALPAGWLAERRHGSWLAATLVAVVLYLDARGLAFYFERGRPDWRPVAQFLRRQPEGERILAAGAGIQLCLGYYANGPDWLCCPRPGQRSIVDIGYDASGLWTSWKPSNGAWLVTPVSGKPTLEPLFADVPSVVFPTADGGVVVRHIGPHAP
ncbi:MAG: glycosyltransferase family 39 protein [Thermoanaerobaculia bacterium]